MANTVRVSSAAELSAEIKNMSGDTTILLEGGNYGIVNLEERLIPNLGSNADLTIKSADDNDPAVFKELNLVGGKDITFDGITFDYTAKSKAPHSYRPFKVEDSEGITFQNSFFEGDDASGHGNFRDGYGTGSGLFVRGSKDIAIENNEFINWETALKVMESDQVDLLNNEISKSSSDGINLAQVTNTLVEGNYIHDFDASPFTLAHKDMIQVWTEGTSSSTENLTIRGNILDSGAGVFTQSIYMFNEDNILYRDITIEDNVIRNAQKHGITIEDARGVDISNNTLILNEDTAGSDDPEGVNILAINIWGNVQGAVVRKNVTPQVNTISKDVTESNNLLIQRNAPTQDGYYDDYFLNALSDAGGTWEDLRIEPGGLLEKSGLGSSLLYWDNTPDEITPLVKFETGVNLQLGEYEFDVSDVYGPNGLVNTSGAKVVWDFGDGSSGTGLKVLHAYDKAGIYDVKGTITLANGTKLDVQKTVEAEAPAAILANFENGAFDRSGEETSYKTPGTARFVKDGGDGALKVEKNGSVRYETTEEFYDNTAFTVMIDYRKDDVNDRGKLISFFGSTVLDVNDHQVSGSVITDKGTVRLTESFLPVANTEWHKVALTFDGERGEIKLYFDGELVASQKALQGAIQEGISSQDFYVGSPLGDSLSGLFDNAVFLRGALTEEEVIAIQEGQITVDAVLDAYTSAELNEVPPELPISSEPEAPKPTPTQSEGPSTGTSSDADSNFSTDPDDYDTARFGDSGRNTIKGTGGDDYQLGYGGNDTLNGYSGGDYLSGGAGRDVIYAGAGNDVVVFDASDAVVHGSSGSDTLYFDKSGNYDATRLTVYSTEIFDMQNGERNTVEIKNQQVRQSGPELLVRADAGDKVIIDEFLTVEEIGQFNQDGERYTRYELSGSGWSERFAIDSDAILEVNDLTFF